MFAPPIEPHQFPCRVLLAVTGLSPQIVTETLFALAVAGSPAWIPTEVQIVTTATGEEKARRTLLSPPHDSAPQASPSLSREPGRVSEGTSEGSKGGWFRRLCEDYRLPQITFGEGSIRVITGPNGEPLDDISTDADNVAVADFITNIVREITADPQASLHVSIAGGRKTMGFYVGYALSLFGRPQDRLSHVLVAPPFESLSDFFYPAPHSRLIRDRNGQDLDAKDARVRLGDIPFVRLREGLPEDLLQGNATFSAAVTEAQKALPPLSLKLDPATQTLVAGGERVELQPQQFALYWMMAERCKAHRAGVHWSVGGIGDELLDYYGRLVGINSGVYEAAEKTYRRNFKKDNFDPHKTHINKAIERVLGERRAAPYLVVKLDRIAGTRYHCYGLELPAEVITIATSLPAQQAAGVAPYSLTASEPFL